ncbi:hypothetical protein BU16DRAFT_244803 [Lophium mytilinum]|uniref:Uncharacterized protein n=1 Tax=Lophium mytilinum TaxID=390894 RepID=A0A6A6RA40_9PEZI|nr:hypothetical protein BU16DRAFT_244803 [Lophium mytilinum]
MRNFRGGRISHYSSQLPHAAFRPPKRYPQPPSNRHQQQRVPRLAHPHATANPTQEQLAIAATIKEWTAGDNLIPAHPRNALHRNDQSSIETKESGPCEDVANVLSQALPPLLTPVAPSVATSRHPSRAGRKLGETRRMRGSSKGKDEGVRGSNRTGVGISAQSNDTRLRKQGGYVLQPKRRPEPQIEKNKRTGGESIRLGVFCSLSLAVGVSIWLQGLRVGEILNLVTPSFVV